MDPGLWPSFFGIGSSLWPCRQGCATQAHFLAFLGQSSPYDYRFLLLTCGRGSGELAGEEEKSPFVASQFGSLEKPSCTMNLPQTCPLFCITHPPKFKSFESSGNFPQPGGLGGLIPWILRASEDLEQLLLSFLLCHQSGWYHSLGKDQLQKEMGLPCLRGGHS